MARREQALAGTAARIYSYSYRHSSGGLFWHGCRCCLPVLIGRTTAGAGCTLRLQSHGPGLDPTSVFGTAGTAGTDLAASRAGNMEAYRTSASLQGRLVAMERCVFPVGRHPTGETAEVLDAELLSVALPQCRAAELQYTGSFRAATSKNEQLLQTTRTVELLSVLTVTPNMEASELPRQRREGSTKNDGRGTASHVGLPPLCSAALQPLRPR